jgi:hypothetical protein
VKAFRLLQAEQPAMLVDVPKPKVGSGQVVLKVGGAGLCHTDGRYGATFVDLAVGKRYDMRRGVLFHARHRGATLAREVRALSKLVAHWGGDARLRETQSE